MLVADVLSASDSLWETGEVKDYSDEDLHILFGAATRILLECGAEKSRRRHGGCDSLCVLQGAPVRRQIDQALSLLHLADVPGLPSLVRQ